MTRIGSFLFMASLKALGEGNAVVRIALRWINWEVLFAITYTASSILLGGLLGALIFGIYWAVMSAVFSKHTGDAFGALGIKDYKHFLRMRFEKDRLTIYPIAIDKVPGRRGWRVPRTGEAMPGHNPQIIPRQSLGPRLIEPPIVIEAAGAVAKAAPRKAA
jgi:hypothetical protein